MTRDELTDRILELFPQLAEVEPWDWAETEDDEPVVMIEKHASFTGLDDGAVDLTAPVPNTQMVGVWRSELHNVYTHKGLAEDPTVKAAGEQAPNN